GAGQHDADQAHLPDQQRAEDEDRRRGQQLDRRLSHLAAKPLQLSLHGSPLSFGSIGARLSAPSASWTVFLWSEILIGLLSHGSTNGTLRVTFTPSLSWTACMPSRHAEGSGRSAGGLHASPTAHAREASRAELLARTSV